MILGAASCIVKLMHLKRSTQPDFLEGSNLQNQTNKRKIKCNVVPVHSMKVYRGKRGVTPPFLKGTKQQEP
jgi:hypothetical protein